MTESGKLVGWKEWYKGLGEGKLRVGGWNGALDMVDEVGGLIGMEWMIGWNGGCGRSGTGLHSSDG